MAELYRYRSALAKFALAALEATPLRGDPGVYMREGAAQAQMNLRGSPSDPRFSRAVERVLGCNLPTEANTVAQGETVRAMWLGPDEWLLLAPPSAREGLAKAFMRMSVRYSLSLTDVSDARTSIVVTGPASREVLMKGCSLDLHPRTFGIGCCAQSSIALCQVIFTQTDDVPSYELYVGRSFAVYLWKWLWDAAEEFGVAVATARDAG